MRDATVELFDTLRGYDVSFPSLEVYLADRACCLESVRPGIFLILYSTIHLFCIAKLPFILGFCLLRCCFRFLFLFALRPGVRARASNYYDSTPAPACLWISSRNFFYLPIYTRALQFKTTDLFLFCLPRSRAHIGRNHISSIPEPFPTVCIRPTCTC